MNILRYIIVFLFCFSNIARADSLPSYSYSEMYMYDNQDDRINTETPSSEKKIHDPFYVINKNIFNINYLLDKAIFAPAAKTYVTVIPERGRMHIGNFMSNIGEPINFFNLLFQGKFKQARISLGRFMTNTVLGFAGILDVATPLKLNYKGTDFGLTLAHYKFSSGPYIVAPILGPTSVRDLSGKVADFFIDPFKYALNKPERNVINATWLLHKRAGATDLIDTVNNSLDPYETAKALYLQNRVLSVNN